MKKFFVAISIILLVVFNIRVCSQLFFGREKKRTYEHGSLNNSLNTYIDYMNTSSLIDPDTLDACVDCIITTSFVEPIPLESLIAVNDLESEIMNEKRKFCRLMQEKIQALEEDITQGKMSIYDQNLQGWRDHNIRQHIDAQMHDPFQMVERQLNAMKNKKELDSFLVRLSKRSDFGEYGMQAVLNLLSIEIAIVDCLLDDRHGYQIEMLVAKRERALCKSMLSVARVYDMILDEATFNTYLEARLQRYARKNGEAHLWKALTRFEKEAFIEHVKDTLIHYHTVIRDIQYALVTERYGA